MAVRPCIRQLWRVANPDGTQSGRMVYGGVWSHCSISVLHLVRLLIVVRGLLNVLGIWCICLADGGQVESIGTFLPGACRMPRAGAPTSQQYDGIYNMYPDTLKPVESWHTTMRVFMS